MGFPSRSWTLPPQSRARCKIGLGAARDPGSQEGRPGAGLGGSLLSLVRGKRKVWQFSTGSSGGRHCSHSRESTSFESIKEESCRKLWRDRTDPPLPQEKARELSWGINDIRFWAQALDSVVSLLLQKIILCVYLFYKWNPRSCNSVLTKCSCDIALKIAQKMHCSLFLKGMVLRDPCTVRYGSNYQAPGMLVVITRTFESDVQDCPGFLSPLSLQIHFSLRICLVLNLSCLHSFHYARSSSFYAHLLLVYSSPP